MRSFRSIAVLGVLLVGLVAYLYFVDSKKPVDQTEEKAKVFAGLDADKIDEIKIDIPDRNDPLKRRTHPKVHEYINRLMDRLDIVAVSA